MPIEGDQEPAGPVASPAVIPTVVIEPADDPVATTAANPTSLFSVLDIENEKPTVGERVD